MGEMYTVRKKAKATRHDSARVKIGGSEDDAVEVVGTVISDCNSATETLHMTSQDQDCVWSMCRYLCRKSECQVPKLSAYILCAPTQWLIDRGASRGGKIVSIATTMLLLLSYRGVGKFDFGRSGSNAKDVSKNPYLGIVG